MLRNNVSLVYYDINGIFSGQPFIIFINVLVGIYAVRWKMISNLLGKKISNYLNNNIY